MVINNGFRQWVFRRHRPDLILAAGVIALLTGAFPASGQWRHAHGDNANTGFARVDTAGPRRPRLAALGSVAPSASPVIGPNGSLYIGNLEGELRAFHPDGTPSWTRKLNPEHGSIFAAPVVGADGSIYVVSSIHHTDPVRSESFLHKFNSGGAWIFRQPFPKSFIHPFDDGGATTATPNIWHWQGTEAIIVPAVYKGLGRDGVGLAAFSTDGIVLANQGVSVNVYEITGGSELFDIVPECLELGIWTLGAAACNILSLIFDPFTIPTSFAFPLKGAGFPLPGVAIRPHPRGEAPLVIATDGRHDLVAYSFSPQSGFGEIARSTNKGRRFTTPPMVKGNGDTIVGTTTGDLVFTGSGFVESSALPGLGLLTAAPTRLHDGRVVVVNREGVVSLLSGSTILSQQTPGGASIASAAASCTHVYVATTEGLFTFDAKNLQHLATVWWVGGGFSAPIIGPTGNVYGIASGVLFAFPGPALGGTTSTTACDVLNTKK